LKIYCDLATHAIGSFQSHSRVISVISQQCSNNLQGNQWAQPVSYTVTVMAGPAKYGEKPGSL